MNGNIRNNKISDQQLLEHVRAYVSLLHQFARCAAGEAGFIQRGTNQL